MAPCGVEAFQHPERLGASSGNASPKHGAQGPAEHLMDSTSLLLCTVLGDGISTRHLNLYSPKGHQPWPSVTSSQTHTPKDTSHVMQNPIQRTLQVLTLALCVVASGCSFINHSPCNPGRNDVTINLNSWAFLVIVHSPACPE